MNPSFFMSNIYGHNAKSIRPTEKVDDNEVREIVQDVIYNTKNYVDNNTSFYQQSVSQENNSFMQKNNGSKTKQKVRISEDLFLAIRQIVKDELKEFKKSLKQKDYSNEFLSINNNFKMMEKEITKLRQYK